MKKMRRLIPDTDPETGDVSYFRPGHTSRVEAIKGQRRVPPPTKGQKAQQRRRKKEHYAGCPVPRPLFHHGTDRNEVSDEERIRLKKAVIAAAGGRCQNCRTKFKLTLDHIIPLSRGGGWHWENLQCLCRKCNRAKGALMPYELAA